VRHAAPPRAAHPPSQLLPTLPGLPRTGVVVRCGIITVKPHKPLNPTVLTNHADHAARTDQLPVVELPLDHIRIRVYRQHWCLRAPLARPSRTRRKRSGRAVAYNDVLTLAPHPRHTQPDPPAPTSSSPHVAQALQTVFIQAGV